MTDSAIDETQSTDETELYGVPLSLSGKQKVLFPERDEWLLLAEKLLNDDWNMCVDLTAVDYLQYKGRALPQAVTPERFEVVACFVSHKKRERIRARVQVPEAAPNIDSLYSLYPGTDYLEREVFDMFGIIFDGHPDLSRILMPETWEGHPLRKDYAVGAIPVQFKYPQGGA